MPWTNRKTGIILLITINMLLALYLGPMDGFRHGHFYEEYDISLIAEEDKYDQISLENAFEMEFSPKKEYLNGFSLYFSEQPEDNEGTLAIFIYDSNGKKVSSTEVDLRKPNANQWYKVDIDNYLKKGETYKLQFSPQACKQYPSFQRVNEDYLPDETISGNIILAYAYAMPTFSLQERIMIVALLIALCLFLAGLLTGKKQSVLNCFAAGTVLVIILSWNYMHNSMDNANLKYTGFQEDSEVLVANVIIAEQAGEYFRNSGEKGYGLGIYYDLKGEVWKYDRAYTTDDNWIEGYSRTEPSIIVKSGSYAREVAVEGNTVKFSNGEEYRITGIDDSEGNIIIHLDHAGSMNPLKYGSLDNITFYDSDHNALHRGRLTAYKSQYGLQGKVFRHLARHMEPENTKNNLYLLCCIALSIVFVLITAIIARKYNKIFAGCFYVTFWLSPWIVCFARNLYWVEFTWFIPMLIGIFCSWKIDDKKCRWGSYIAGFLAICLKCLCGYEFISTVMMGLIAILLVDAAEAAIKTDRKKFILLLRTIFILGVMALAGFALALLIHANIKGGGNILYGIKRIIVEDVLRRTNGADFNDFDSKYWSSFNASVWETFSRYFKFDTEVITGITGNLFPLLCIIPLCIFGIDQKKGRLNPRLPIMYIVFFLTSVSWFCLAKGHSFIHTHVNFVLWYFGFVQLCLYVIADKVAEVFKKTDMEKAK